MRFTGKFLDEVYDNGKELAYDLQQKHTWGSVYRMVFYHEGKFYAAEYPEPFFQNNGYRDDPYIMVDAVEVFQKTKMITYYADVL